MNYIKIHDLIIERAKSRNILNFETHHINPRCLGGSDDLSNLVRLAPREHYLIHYLLSKIHPESSGLTYAFWLMCSCGRYKVSSRVYEQAKLSMAKIRKVELSKFNHWNGRKHRSESRAKMSESAKTRKITLENEVKRREGISKNNMKKKSEQHRQNIAKAKLGNKNPMFGKKWKNEGGKRIFY